MTADPASSADALFRQALQSHQAGRLEEAERYYNQVLQHDPRHAGSFQNLGIMALQVGKPDLALHLLEKAREINGRLPGLYSNLGIALKAVGRIEEAVQAYRLAIDLEPGLAAAHNNLGNLLGQLGRLDEAAEACRRSVALSPGYADGWNGLATVLREQGRLAEAVECAERAIGLQPGLAPAHNTLGTALQSQGRLDEAAGAYQRALELAPGFAEAYSNLGHVRVQQGRLPEAVELCRAAVARQPGLALAHTTLATTLALMGEVREAEACFQRSLALDPRSAPAQSNRLYTLAYDGDLGAPEIFESYRSYGSAHDEAGRPRARVSETAGRRLRVGYVSPDFRVHAIRNFLEPVWMRHDRSAVELFAYSATNPEDAVTDLYRDNCDAFVRTAGLSDEALAERIRADGIDVLVDIAGHTGGNRLGAFALKPAPVSLTWLGTGYTTGLGSIDYLLADAVMAPEGSEGLFSESPWRLSSTYVYRPAGGMGEPGLLPALARGHVTFGVLTRAIRINRHTIRVWSELLKRVEGSRLVVNSRDFQHASMQAHLRAQFAEQGIGAERLEIGFDTPPWDVLRGIDIGLDCFPHNSGTTLVESLYMGVPIVSLMGRPSVGRIGASMLTALGRPEWVAQSEEAYIALAAGLAADLPALAQIRQGLRAEMEASRLMDEQGFVRELEDAYRRMLELRLSSL